MKTKSPPPLRGLMYYLRCKARGLPMLVNLEFTKKCNARCHFCMNWQLDSSGEIEDYAPVIKKFRPVLVSISGGEPLLRKNYDELIRKLRPYCHYVSLITNGALLNRESADRLISAGVDQISVSLDYIGKEHDKARMIEGLYDHIEDIVPKLAGLGIKMSLNTIIMESNLDQILPLAYKAKEWGIGISYSAYCTLKSDSSGEMVRTKQYAQLVAVIEEIKKLKHELKNIRNSNYYLSRIPEYFRNGVIPGCQAGFKWMQVTPDGYIQQCSEMPRLCRYDHFEKSMLKKVACAKCWYTCRGELEASHLKPDRLVELIRA